MDTKQLLEFIEHRRQQCGMPVTVMTRRAGLTAETWHTWWRGTRQPKLEPIMKLLAVFGNSLTVQ
jgi:hypothetical protein